MLLSAVASCLSHCIHFGHKFCRLLHKLIILLNKSHFCLLFFLIKSSELLQRQQLSITQQFGASAFCTVVRWHKLREVDNECILHNSIVLAICVLNIIKFGADLAKFWQKQVESFFGTPFYYYIITVHNNVVVFSADGLCDWVYSVGSQALAARSPSVYLEHEVQHIQGRGRHRVWWYKKMPSIIITIFLLL